MAISKVVWGTVPLIDLTQDTVDAAHLSYGYTAHDKAGNVIVGANVVFAAIFVAYPAGSTCTCSKGNITLTAQGTGGSYIFLVPEAGDWTVACTNGSSSTSQNATITEQYEIATVALGYNIIAYNRGNENVPVTGGIITASRGGGATTKETADIKLYSYAEYGWVSWANALTDNLFSLDNYSVVKVIAKASGSNNHKAYIVIQNAAGTYVARVEITKSSSENEYSLDISEVTGEYRVGALIEGGHSSGGSSNATAYIYEIMVE